MTTHTRFIVERNTGMPHWEPVAFPKNNLDDAKQCLALCRGDELRKSFRGKLRLVKETREIIDTD